MIEIIVLVGVFFLGIGTLGLIRFPGTLNRMHATSKSATLGVGFVAIAAAIEFYPDGSYLSALLTLFFLFMTAPTGAHLIARATYQEEEEKSQGASLRRFLQS